MTDYARDVRRALAVLVLGIAVSAAPGVSAQEVTQGFGGFATDSNAPIDIESDTLEVNDRTKIAIFRGNVKAVQGGMTIHSKELHVNYVGDTQMAGAPSASAGTAETSEGGGSQITQIEAKGKVLIVTDRDQTVTSQWALFDIKRNMVTIGGDVVLSQGGNVIKGDQLLINLTTGESRFQNEGNIQAGRRVRGLFRPGKSDGGDTSAAPAPAGAPQAAGQPAQ